ncbi:hypothetical protein JCM30237_25790 [Halolamina litorea]|uniref:Uncharacterized protein n=1 Tax=Halolamina litorea TaxID=1515593 RepID=A0ABD6BUY7_9EURY|nr:hypothetical protein [Halolamina litorea]
MAPDDSDIDATPGDGSTETPADSEDDTWTDPQTVDSPLRDLPERLSSTVSARRSYGLERVTTGDSGALLSPRERQYVKHAERLDPPEQTAVEEVVADRVGEFMDVDWPVIQEAYPDVAAAVREDICPDES